MARPQKIDRSTVATDTLTLRLSPTDRASLDALVAAKSSELAAMGVELTAASYVRGLIRQEASRALPSATTRPPVVLNMPSLSPAPMAERRAVPRPDGPSEGKVRAELDRLLATGTRKSEVCRASGIDAAHLHRWMNRKMGISPPKLAGLATALETLAERGAKG